MTAHRRQPSTTTISTSLKINATRDGRYIRLQLRPFLSEPRLTRIVEFPEKSVVDVLARYCLAARRIGSFGVTRGGIAGRISCRSPVIEQIGYLMNQLLKKLSFAFVALSFAGLASAAVEAPDALVKRLSEDILATAKNDKQIQAGSQTRIQQVVDEKIIPHVDFQRTTALAVGRSWRQATPEQKAQLTEEFKKLLTFTYTGAISQVTNQKFEYLPFRAAADDKDVVVNTRVVQPRGEPVQLSYRLIKSDSGWKIYDINVLGAWLIESYKGSFATEINKSGIDGLIASLKDRNAKLAANVAKSGGKAVASPSKAEEIAK